MQTKLVTTELIIMVRAVLHNIAISRIYPILDDESDRNDDNDNENTDGDVRGC